MAMVTRKFEVSDLDAVQRLYEQNFGAKMLERWKNRWRWQFAENPASGEQDASIWVAELDGAVIAQLAAFPVRMKIMDREMTVQFECDFPADQQARTLNPVWPMQFICEALEKNGTPIKGGVDYTDAHRRMRVWLKHKPLAIAAHCSRPCRAGPKLRELADAGKLPSFLARGPIGAVADAALTAAIKAVNALRAPAVDPNLAIKRIDEAGAEFDQLWRKLRGQYAITTVRDQAFARWRFFEDPAFDNVVFGAYGADAELVGYVVVRTGLTDEGDFMGRILDLFCDLEAPSVASSLLAAGVRHLEQAGVRTITCRGMHRRLLSVIRKSFYVPSTAEYEAEEPALMLWTGPAELADGFYESANWHYTYADGSGGFSP